MKCGHERKSMCSSMLHARNPLGFRETVLQGQGMHPSAYIACFLLFLLLVCFKIFVKPVRQSQIVRSVETRPNSQHL